MHGENTQYKYIFVIIPKTMYIENIPTREDAILLQNYKRDFDVMLIYFYVIC